jgi:very-short-patch-repair endonuclease
MWRAALFACGPTAALSHGTAAAWWKIREEQGNVIHVSVPKDVRRRLPGIRCHRRSNLNPSEVLDLEGIRVTSPATTLVDIAHELPVPALERSIKEADKLELIDPERLRMELESMPPRPGKARLRRLLDRHTFVLTDSELERCFAPIARRAGLGKPVTGAELNGFRVDFWWPQLGLVVETDGLRYHRTPAQQTSDRLRDQAHAAAGLTPLRFTHAQVRYEPAHVERVLREVMASIAPGAAASGRSTRL